MAHSPRSRLARRNARARLRDACLMTLAGIALTGLALCVGYDLAHKPAPQPCQPWQAPH